jgi:hypothetical protein
MLDHSDHHRITAAGWAYRTNSRGWINYLNPQTGVWQTHSQAISLIHSQVPNSSAGVGAPSDEIPASEFAER